MCVLACVCLYLPCHKQDLSVLDLICYISLKLNEFHSVRYVDFNT